MKSVSIVVAVNSGDDGIDALKGLLRTQGPEWQGVELILVDRALMDRRSQLDAAAPQAGQWDLRYASNPGASLAAAFNMGFSMAAAEWVSFHQGLATVTSRMLQRLRDFAPRNGVSALLSVAKQALEGPTSGVAGERRVAGNDLDLDLRQCPSFALQRELMLASALRFDDRVRPGFAMTALLARYLLLNRKSPVAVIELAEEGVADALEDCELDASTWSNPQAYDDFLVHGLLQALTQTGDDRGGAPRWLQRTVLMELQRYFSADMCERSPTVIVNGAMADRFHEVVARIMRHIDVDSIALLGGRAVRRQVMHALLSYKSPACWSSPCASAFDHDQGLLRLTYYVHGRKPAESFVVDGSEVEPAYSKYRAYRFFRRQLFSERIVWLPVEGARSLSMQLDGHAAQVYLHDAEFLSGLGTVNRMADTVIDLAVVRAALPPGRSVRPAHPTLVNRLKRQLLRFLSSLPPIRQKFSGSWIFSDRSTDADDNAEHLYRWVRRHHPELNIWFVLDRSSEDWARLKKEGFRFLPVGFIRKLAIVNADHIISSHMDLLNGALDPRVYGALMKWRFTFLQHGVTYNDLSHWLSDKPIDVFVTASPAEHASIVSDDTPYSYTEREVPLTGFPRHDQLTEMSLEYPTATADLLFVMPTWRSTLSGRVSKEGGYSETVRDSEYVQRWRGFLASERLKNLAERHAKQVVFMPHPNAMPYLDAFDLPGHVRVVTRADARMQELFCRSAVLITDFSSVAFEAAYLRRPVVYYQFDRQQFFGGAHNWREGYFEYERDGFGPIVDDEERLLIELESVFVRHGEPEPKYLARMERALPLRDGLACARVFESILSCVQPYPHSHANKQRAG